MSKNPKLYYTAGELADLFELPKQTLLYYDKMGILSPEFISENNYRHYSLKQYLILEVEHELDFIVVFDIYTSSVAV